MTTLTESPGVIELSDGTDFKLNLITIPTEMDSPPHHSGHVHPECDVPVHSESSRSSVTSACRRFPLSQPCPPTCDCCATPDVTMLQFTRTHLPREVADTFFWWPGAWDPSASRDMGLFGACAGCWWVGRRETGHFLRHTADGRQERQGRGERELPRTEGDARATSQAKTSSCTPSIRRSATPFTTSTSSSAPSRSRSPRAWRSWRPSAGCS